MSIITEEESRRRQAAWERVHLADDSAPRPGIVSMHSFHLPEGEERPRLRTTPAAPARLSAEDEALDRELARLGVTRADYEAARAYEAQRDAASAHNDSARHGDDLDAALANVGCTRADHEAWLAYQRESGR